MPLTLSKPAESLLKRLSRRLALGLFFEIWTPWAAGSLLVASVVVLAFRVFPSNGHVLLPWLWLAPAFALVPALALSWRRAYRRTELLALADSLGGGRGTLLALAETGDAAWADSPDLLPGFAMPSFRLWRRIRLLIPAALFLAIALALPQRARPGVPEGALGREIAKDLEGVLAAIKKQELISPEEEKKLEEEIERIRQSAKDRVDPGAWEAADALREKMAAGLSEKRDALKWAEESLLRYADAIKGGATPTEAETDELAKALEKLFQNGMLGDLPADIQKMLGGERGSGKFNLPSDPAEREKLAQSLSEALGQRGQKFGDLSKLGREFSRFDPAEFPLDSDGLDENGLTAGQAGNGGLDRGRGDATLTWGKETDPADRFKAQALPPGMARRPDDWAPVALLPGAPKADPKSGAAAAARGYDPGAGQAAWRRTLAPRHYSAVKNYFEK